MQKEVLPITKKDIALSNFAKALALPVRVCIIRMVIENENKATREHLHNIPFNPNTVNQHLSELKTLGILTAKANGRTMFYSVNEQLFISMSNNFLALFDSINSLKGFSDKINIDLVTKKKMGRVKAATEPVDPAVEVVNVAAPLCFGKYLKDKRGELKISQQYLAIHLEVERPHLSRIECEKKTLKAEKLPKLAEIFRVSLEEIKRVYYNDRINKLAKEYNEGNNFIAVGTSTLAKPKDITENFVKLNS